MPSGIYKRTLENRKALSDAKKGKRPKNLGISFGVEGKNAYNWKGQKVSYDGLHKWIRKTLGSPNRCELCGNDSLRPRQYHWANKSGKYKRKVEDWIRLCVKCHWRYDGRKVSEGLCECGSKNVSTKMCRKCYNRNHYLKRKEEIKLCEK